MRCSASSLSFCVSHSPLRVPACVIYISFCPPRNSFLSGIRSVCVRWRPIALILEILISNESVYKLQIVGQGGREAEGVCYASRIFLGGPVHLWELTSRPAGGRKSLHSYSNKAGVTLFPEIPATPRRQRDKVRRCKKRSV